MTLKLLEPDYHQRAFREASRALDANVAANTDQKSVRGRPWRQGQSGNLRGRPRGARNKLAERFLADLYASWQRDGDAAIVAVRTAHPDEYLKIIATVIPRALRSQFGIAP